MQQPPRRSSKRSISCGPQSTGSSGASSAIYEKGGEEMKIEIRIDGDPEQVARFLKEMAVNQILDLGRAHKFLDFPIEELELGVRTYHCLKRVEIEKLGDLVSKTAEELGSIPNFGRRQLEEVQRRLAVHGLHLRTY